MLPIIKLVVVDNPTARVLRRFLSFQTVIVCRRNPNENLSMFVSHFRGLADRNLIQAQASPSSQTGHVLAITPSNNAELDGDTLTNAKSDLINFAKNRKEKKVKNSVCVRSVLISEFTDTVVCSSELEDL